MPHKNPAERRAYMNAYNARKRGGPPPAKLTDAELKARRAARAKTPEAIALSRKAGQKRWREASADLRASWALKKRYGITLTERRALVAAQREICPVCGKAFNMSRPRTLHTDHIHGTKIVRGVTHAGCNTALGRLGDSVEGLTRALVYVSMGVTSVELIDEYY